MFDLFYEFPIFLSSQEANQINIGRQFLWMTDDINMKCLDFLIFVCFSPFRDAIKLGLNASYTLTAVLQWELNMISCVWNIPLLYYYVTEGKVRQAFLNVVISWNGDLANLPMVFPSTEVQRNVSFVEGSESYDSQGVSLSRVIFEWSMLYDASPFNYLLEGLGAMILCTAAFCSCLLIDLWKGCCGCWTMEDSCESDDGVTYVHCVVLLSCGSCMEHEPIVFFVQICSMNFRIGLIVYIIDHNPHYCPL